MADNELISVSDLTVKYKDYIAVDHVSFSVKEREVFGIIGTNGAGKTSLVEAVEGIRPYHTGKVSILGMDPHKERKKLFGSIGVQLQESGYPSHATVRDVCKLFSSFYEKVTPYNELLKELGIEKKEKAYVSKLSGGEKQKLSILLSLICQPKIVFWDELTTGLDPTARYDLYEKILHYKRQGLSIVLISHYMEEIEKLCDRVAIMKSGKIIALGTPKELMQEYNVSSLDNVFLQISK